MLINANHIYVGTGADVGLRVATGQQPIATSTQSSSSPMPHGNLSEDDAKSAERLLWSRVAGARARVLVNGIRGLASVGGNALVDMPFARKLDRRDVSFFRDVAKGSWTLWQGTNRFAD